MKTYCLDEIGLICSFTVKVKLLAWSLQRGLMIVRRPVSRLNMIEKAQIQLFANSQVYSRLMLFLSSPYVRILTIVLSDYIHDSYA
jgi:hypothetical protein